MTTTHTITINGGKRELQGRGGMTLFAALRSRGILLPTGCGARGVCGQCKVRLTTGGVGLMTDSEARLISEEERAEGKRLACQARIEGDVGIEIPDYVFDAREHPATLREIVPLTHDIARFTFALAGGDAIPHKAGQFLTLTARVPDVPGTTMRCFSFSTPSRVVDTVDIIVRRNPAGAMTPYLLERARPGDAFGIVGPYGDFHLRDGDAPCVWIAGGSGLSPFMGMLRDMLDNGVRRPVRLFFGAVHPRDLYYVDLLNDVAAQNDWFTFTPALSGDERCAECADYGLITDVVGKYIGDASGMEGYLCGGPGMIGACVKLLTERGMHRDHIYYDRF